MRLLRHLDGAVRTPRGYVATIGGFDGIHRGHQELLARVACRAAEQQRDSLLITFEPLPREYFQREDPPARLTTLRERWRLLEQGGPEALCVLRFDERLRGCGAGEFAGMLLSAGIGHLVIGHDFRAGRDGEATAEWFQKNCPARGMGVEVVSPVRDGPLRISSRAVRQALAQGDLEAPRVLLGRRYSMVGRVVRGQQLGRKLGFPTANLRLGRRRTPMDGIFAVRVRGLGNGHPPQHYLPGVASLGTRPTVGGVLPLLEAHVFGFDGDLYGREIEVEFVARLRDELRFDNVDAMVVQMHRDADDARAALSRAGFD
ncbi:MAG: bifunctional riboflavin kinase/FAD synthetase [Steroidobacteraceae bacterium]